MSGSLSALEQWPHVMMNTYGIPQVELVSGSGAGHGFQRPYVY